MLLHSTRLSNDPLLNLCSTFLRSIDKDGDNKISFGEFASFVLLREEALQRIYRGFLVARQDGKDVSLCKRCR